MATNPLPILLGIGALFLLKGKKKDAPKTDEKAPAAADDTKPGTEPADDQKVPKTLDDVDKGSTNSLPPPNDLSTPSAPKPTAPTTGPSGYSGVTRSGMMTIQAQLTQLGYEPGKIDGLWKSGGTTFGAVKSFQYDYDLQVDGKPGPITRETLTSVIEGTFIEPPITPNDYSGPSGYADVNMAKMMDIQKQLNQTGFDPGVIDGIWVRGGKTYNATRNFQSVYGLQIDGRPGPQTQAILLEVIAANESDPQPQPKPTPAPLPDLVPAEDTSLFVIDTKLMEITKHPDFKKPMLLVEQERASGSENAVDFAYGYDIYQDQRTLNNDGRYIGAVMATTPDTESSIWFFRSDPATTTPSANGRIAKLAERLEGVIKVLKTEMT